MQEEKLLSRVIVDTRSLWHLILIATALLWLANAAAGVLVATGHMAYNHPFYLIFCFNLERNLPTFFSGCLFLFNALLLYTKGLAAPRKSRDRFVWLLLAGLLVFLAADELFAIHERLVKPVREAFGLGGLLYFSWVLVYGLAALVLLALLLPFWWAMPVRLRLLYFASAAVYLCGVIGVEMLGGRHVELNGGRNFAYFVMYTAEESLEILGLLLLTGTQLLRPELAARPVRVSAAAAQAGPGAAAAPGLKAPLH